MTPPIEARCLLRKSRHGMLATLSKKFGGHPFGSIVPFLLDSQGCPLILISTLAEHTKNIDHDRRVSLLVFETGTDVQAEARVTLLGDCARVADPEKIKPRYLRYFPNAAGYFATHDFFFYRIEPKILRYIGGFGEIHWISTETYAPPANELEAQEEMIISHMNNDHAQALRDYCRHYHGLNAHKAMMAGIDCDGFDVLADGNFLRFDFTDTVLDAIMARQALVAMSQESRRA